MGEIYLDLGDGRQLPLGPLLEAQAAAESGQAAGCSWHALDLCSLCVAPGTLVDLRYFLERRPHAWLTDLGGTRHAVRFNRWADGGLYFRAADAGQVAR